MRDEGVQLVHLHDLSKGWHRAHGQGVAGGGDPVDDGLWADADEAGGAPEVCAVYDQLEGEGAYSVRVASFLGLECVVASAVLAVQALRAATVQAGFGLAGRRFAGGTRMRWARVHFVIFGNSCAKLDTPMYSP